MRKICVVTGSRAEYGLLYWLMKEIDDDPELELQIVVTGMHLSPEFGLTWQQLKQDGFSIYRKVEMLLSSDTPVGIAKSMGVSTIGFADVYDQLKPDIVVLLGDRFEIFPAASVALIFRIAVAHIHGGETTEGAFDESIRHSLTKLSHLHFTATEEYKQRVIQLGENSGCVYNFGGLGLDNIKKLKLLSQSDFEKSIHFKLNKKNLLITFHPATLEAGSPTSQMQALIDAVDTLEDTGLIFTKPNADTDGRGIIELIDHYVAKNPEKSIAFSSLGQMRYLSALKYIDGVVGNSSSGIIEAPAMNIGTINIGDRQKGRVRATSIVDCEPTKQSILKAVELMYSKTFQSKLKTTENPYGKGGAAEKIKETLKSVNLSKITKKRFYDIKR